MNDFDQIVTKKPTKRRKSRLYPDAPDIEAYNTVDGRPSVKLYGFQEAYLRGVPAKHIFAADTGTGKTFMSLAHYDRKGYLKPLLILAPANKVNNGDWERDVNEYFAGRLMPPIEIYSYEKFSRKTSLAQYRETKSRGVWHDWLQRYPHGYAVICDEVHKAKNPQSGVGKAVYEVGRRADMFIGLSATPLPNGWIDAVNYFKIFGYVRNITEFKRDFCEIVTHKGFPEIKRYKQTELLTRWWNQIAKPLSKSAALDLPDMTFIPVRHEAGKEYVKVQKERLFEGKFIDNPSALLHALRQTNTAPKVQWLDDFLEGVSGNVVVFYNYTTEREAILAMIKKKHANRKVYRQDGDKHEIPPKLQWPGPTERTITLAQYQSGSTGIELTYAATTVYFSPTYSYSDYEQSIGRTNRNGQTQKMTFYLLCAPATVERDVWDALRNKTNFQSEQWAHTHLV